MSKTKIIYKDIAPNAENDAAVSGQNTASYSDVNAILQGKDEANVITLELNQWELDGEHEYHAEHTYALWSDETAGADCRFEKEPVVTITTGAQYSSVGLTLEFGGEAWATDVNVKWYQGSTLLAEKDYAPDGMSYYLAQNVKAYNKVVLTFKKMSVPYMRLKLKHFIFGLIRTFGMSELRSAKITSDMGMISQEIPIAKFRWVLDDRSHDDYMLQLKQPVEVLNDDRLIGIYYIDNYSRKAEKIYDIEGYDAFGVLSESNFDGGVYNAKSAKAIVSEIIGTTFPVTYGSGITDRTLTGIIQGGSKRDALQQVLFAWGVCAVADKGNGIHIFNLPLAKTDNEAVVTSDDCEVFSELDLVSKGSEDSNALTLELNRWVLNNLYTVQTAKKQAYWSRELCGDDCTFANAPKITLSTNEQYSTSGLTITFGGDAYATDFNVKWYRGAELLEDKNFSADAMTYQINQRVESYNKIVITFLKMSLPNRRAKVNHVLFGQAPVIGKDRTFTGVNVDTRSITTQVLVYAHTYTQDANGSITIGGTKYRDDKTVYSVVNPNVTATDKQSVVKVENATLISKAIAAEAAQRVYDYYERREQEKAKIVWQGEKLGDVATMANAWGGKQTGNIEGMDINLSNTVIAEIRLR